MSVTAAAYSSSWPVGFVHQESGSFAEEQAIRSATKRKAAEIGFEPHHSEGMEGAELLVSPSYS